MVRNPFYVGGWRKLALAVFMLSLVAINFGWAQGPLCSEIVTGNTDNSCNGFTSLCDSSDHGCGTQYTFTASCTGAYTIDAWLTSSGTLTQCKVCVVVRKHVNHAIVGSCVLDVCTEGFTKTCADAASLDAGTEYDLQVCLTYCSTQSTCANHCANCVAHGCVRYAVTAPCY